MGSSDGSRYDDASVDSIVGYAKLLIGKSLAQATGKPLELLIAKGKGGLGTLVSKAFFDLEVDTKPLPDFERAGLELKVTPMKRLKTKENRLVAKERLVLSMIDYQQVIHETWETSRLIQKCRLMLVLTYLHETNRALSDLVFLDKQVILNLLDPNSVDSAQFKRDWETIQAKVSAQKAHELSGSDTMYLEALNKGQGKGRDKLRPQGDSQHGAKPRAFAIKPSYLTVLLNGKSNKNVLLVHPDTTIEEATSARFKPYLGQTIDSLQHKFSQDNSPLKNKNFHRNLALTILSRGGSSVPELQKADIELKVIRRKKSGALREDMSFPNFIYVSTGDKLGIIDQDWEDSEFFQKLDKKFLFVVFREGVDGKEFLDSVGYWNMPFKDKLEAKSVWEETKRRVIREDFSFPKSTENSVAHVRNKGPNSLATYPTPGGGQAKRYCFWLNKSYLIKALIQLETKSAD
jgi:DNA mismatch repair protein MutH